MAHRQPRRNTLAPNTSTPSPRKLAAIAPTTAPSAAPTNRCKETGRAAPSDDCVITIVVIGAQYASGSRNSRAMNKEITATQAVRAEWIKTGQMSLFLICIGHRLARPIDTLVATPGCSARTALNGSMPDRRIYRSREFPVSGHARQGKVLRLSSVRGLPSPRKSHFRFPPTRKSPSSRASIAAKCRAARSRPSSRREWPNRKSSSARCRTHPYGSC